MREEPVDGRSGTGESGAGEPEVRQPERGQRAIRVDDGTLSASPENSVDDGAPPTSPENSVDDGARPTSPGPFEIPAENLPPGFAERVEAPPDPPARPRPAATAVLLRDGERGPEVLLLRRPRGVAFVPGAWVFPGGRVDPEDSDAALEGLTDGAPVWDPPLAYWVAAVREVFEETGVLLARRTARAGAEPADAGPNPSGPAGPEQPATPAPAPGAPWVPDASDYVVEAWRDALLREETTFLEVLREGQLRLDLAAVVPCAHWVTPRAEPRRYDTRFFLARLPEERVTRLDPREMEEEAWLRPADALERYRAGRLPMVFPTVRTLDALTGFATVGEALDAFRGRAIPRLEPRLVRTERGVAILLEE